MVHIVHYYYMKEIVSIKIIYQPAINKTMVLHGVQRNFALRVFVNSRIGCSLCIS